MNCWKGDCLGRRRLRDLAVAVISGDIHYNANMRKNLSKFISRLRRISVIHGSVIAGFGLNMIKILLYQIRRDALEFGRRKVPASRNGGSVQSGDSGVAAHRLETGQLESAIVRRLRHLRRRLLGLPR